MTDLPSESHARSRIVRILFPSMTSCTFCGKKGHRENGRSRQGNIRYRICLHCGENYRVCAIGHERDEGGMQSIIVLW